MYYISKYISPIGEMIMAAENDCLVGLWFERQRHIPKILNRTVENKDLYIFQQTTKWLDEYFDGYQPNFIPSIKMLGTCFQKQVWQILTTIPYSQTATYKDIARQIAEQRKIASMSAQAVGGAVGRNPISIIIPCHRVIGSDGSLVGYAGGIDRKLQLLKMEKVCTNTFLNTNK